MNRGGGMGKPFSATNKLVLVFAAGFQRMEHRNGQLQCVYI